ncbi:sensor histidine kinase [Methylocapsa polymorpha]|uniref:histidine kinase n=2 Tax=Methylocapsa polymorpha TaxID=3080828 RepID=A0ABZ0HW06_9HYPH|nr:sensor histidine kinase [Methylocapsa sp. RX1]
MLILARRKMTDRAAQRALTEASDRITAMGVVQRRLLHDPESRIDLDAFLHIFCADLEKALGIPIACHGERLQALDSQTISSIALVVQEFVSNAVEHGARPDAPMTLTVRMESRGFDRGAVIVEDDGKGLPPDFCPGRSLGLALVHSFVQSIGGAFDIRNRPHESGVIATVEFPLTATGRRRAP